MSDKPGIVLVHGAWADGIELERRDRIPAGSWVHRECAAVS